MLQDPRRMARRYVVGNAAFSWLVVRALAGRMRGRDHARALQA